MSDVADAFCYVHIERGHVVIELDVTTAQYVQEALYALGEHIAAGVQVPSMPTEVATRLGGLMNSLAEVVR